MRRQVIIKKNKYITDEEYQEYLRRRAERIKLQEQINAEYQIEHEAVCDLIALCLEQAERYREIYKERKTR